MKLFPIKILKEEYIMKKVAYFTMEIAPALISDDITKDFRTYSGGLGVLAGDYFKQATDESRPITFISILWKRGYNKQEVENGNIIDIPNSNDTWQDYVTDTGKTVKVKIEEFEVTLKIWKYNDGELYMLDADLDCNNDYRYLTYNLYGGNEHFENQAETERICQEIILGIGGLSALKVLNKQVYFYHFNDGHAIFAVHKLIYDFMEYGLSFEDAINMVKYNVRFTTHTNVESGNEKHDINDLIKYNANYGLNYSQLEKLGGNPYGMTVAAFHTSGKSNAVAIIHSDTANELWKYLNDIPTIFPITNGIHLPTWQYENIHQAYLNHDLDQISELHTNHKKELIDLIYEKNGIKLNKDYLLIGFARRATGYKRWDLFAKIPEAIDYLINVFHVQFVFAGKCHKDDYIGRQYIQNICKLTEKYPNNVIFLKGYDVNIAKKLEGGSDIWLNTPNGLEASGTSGMKAGANGCINFSTLDGWWKEACIHGVNGFEIHMHDDIKNTDERNTRDCQSLLYYLNNDILSMYINDRHSWSKIMYESIKTIENYFTTERMIKEYFEQLYI
jgi:starch phosphorylase